MMSFLRPKTSIAAIAALLALSVIACRRGPEPEQPPVARPEKMTAEAWLAAWQEAVGITGEITRSSEKGSWGFTNLDYRNYSLSLAVRNRSDYPLACGENLFLVEAASAAGASRPVLEVAGGSFVSAPPENFSGSVEFRGKGQKRRADPGSPFDFTPARDGEDDQADDMGLYNSQTCLKGGGLIRHIPPLIMFTLGGGDDDSKDAFEDIPPGEERKVETEFQLSVMVRRDHCDQVWVVTPEMTARDRSGASVAFRGLLKFSPPPAAQNASGKDAWTLASATLLPMTEEAVLPLLDDAAAPLWQRVFASYWAFRWPESSAAKLQRIAAAKGTENDALRAGAIRSLGKIRRAESFALLLETARDAKAFPRLRTESVRALGRLGNVEAASHLIGWAKNDDPALGDDAVKALGDLGDRTALEPLLGILRSDAREDDHGAVAAALSKLADAGAVGRLGEIARSSRKGADEAITVLGKIGGAAVTTLTELMKSADASTRSGICAALGPNDTPEALAALQAALEDKDADVRAASALALGEADTDARAAALAAALGHKDEKVRRIAIEGLAANKRSGASAKIASMAGDAEEAEGVRIAAIKAMAEAPDEAARQALKGLASDPKADVRSEALRTLGRIGGVEARAVIVQALGDKESAVRSAAAAAFRKLGKTDDFTAFIEALLKEKETPVLRAEVDALIALEFKDLSALPAVADRLAALDADGREQILRLLEHMSGNKDISLESGANKAEVEAAVQKWKDWHAGSTDAGKTKE